jgi:type II secretory pathway predicted ATPase ExeA
MIAFRLTVAGANRNPFTSQAALAVFRSSLGLPRAICQICDMALLAGLSASTRVIDEPTISLAASGLRIDAKEISDGG